MMETSKFYVSNIIYYELQNGRLVAKFWWGMCQETRSSAPPNYIGWKNSPNRMKILNQD